MSRKGREIRHLLMDKFGFTESTTDHYWYELSLPDLPTIKAKISFGSKTYDDKLQGYVARQLLVRRRFYEEMMNCSRSREDYYQIVQIDPFKR